MGGVRLVDGTQLSVVTGIDDYSRFCVIAKLVPRATARPVADALLDGLSRHGVPTPLAASPRRVSAGHLPEARRSPVCLIPFQCLLREHWRTDR